MGQANTPPPAPSFFMTRKILGKFLAAYLAILASVTPQAVAQEPKTSPRGPAALTAEKAITLAEQGRCKEALPALRKARALGGVQGINGTPRTSTPGRRIQEDAYRGGFPSSWREPG